LNLSERKSLLEWFGKRRESVVMSGIRDHIRAVGDAVSELNRAVAALYGSDKDRAMEALNRMLLSEQEADNLEARIATELSKGDMEAKEREDLMRLVRRMDYIADWSKESGMNLQLILEAGVKVPVSLWSHYHEMTIELEKAARELRASIENLGINEEMASKHSREVERLEHVLDELYFVTKKEILFSDIDPRAVFLLRDMLHGIENAADSCKDVADIIHILITSEAHKVK
jgi:predicted phosphate transport protein (TIGR00153 family)